MTARRIFAVIGGMLLLAGAGASVGLASPTPARGLYQFMGQVDSQDASNPQIDGALLMFTWTQLEPTRGGYNWNAVDAAIQPWRQAGKKFALRVQTASSVKYNAPWNANTNGNATPAWVYSDGVRSVQETDGSILPVYWDPAYQQDLSAFVTALAGRYNSSPDLTFVEAASGFDGESFVDGISNPNKLALWQSVGYTDTVWENTAFAIWDLYRHAFSVPVAPELKGGQISGANLFGPLAEHAIAAGMWANHNGLETSAYGGTYASELSKAGTTTAAVLEEKAAVSSTTDLLAEIKNAIAVHAEIVLVYPQEVSNSAWLATLATARAEIDGATMPSASPSPAPSPTPAPLPSPVSISNFPCTVQFTSGPRTGHCSGTFQP